MSHPSAHKKNLMVADWWAAFLAEHERRTGLDAADLSQADCVTAYYSTRTTPYEAVSEDIRRHGLTDADRRNR